MTGMELLAALVLVWLVAALAVGLVVGGLVRARDRFDSSAPQRRHERLRLVV